MAEGRVKGMVVLSREPIRYTNDMQLRRKEKTQASLHFAIAYMIEVRRKLWVWIQMS